MRSLAILGRGGHGKVVAEAALLSGWKSISFFDDMKDAHLNIPGELAEILTFIVNVKILMVVLSLWVQM